MSDPLTPADEQALDAFLAETLGNSGPPDLSTQILAQIHETPLKVGSIVPAETAAPDRNLRSSSLRKPVIAVITVIAAVAACFLCLAWLRTDDGLQELSPSIAASDTGVPRMDAVANVPSSPTGVPKRDEPNDPVQGLANASAKQPSRGIPLVMDATGVDDRAALAEANENTSPRSSIPLQAVALVSNHVDSKLRDYWDAIGIEPGRDLSAEETAVRLSRVLGIELMAASVDDAQQMQAELSQRANARVIANRWLQQITSRGLLRVEQEAKDGLLEDLVACFQSNRPLDRTLALWVSGQSPHASAFYAAISAGAKRSGDNSGMARRLAALTMNVDLRCTRCHDSFIEGNGRQHDFWRFAALLRRGVRRGPDNQVMIEDSFTPGKPFFYELPDGRQRVVEPGIATAWMRDPSGQPIGTMRQWADALLGSPELARGVVNSLWQLVYGQPLRGRVVDPISAPHNEALDQLEVDLVQDLVNSNFDIVRTLALIIASPATRREVPESLLAENALLASESDTRAAMNAVDAFAAAMPPRVELPLRVRLDEAMRAIGAKLDSDGRPLLGQLAETAEQPGKVKGGSNFRSAKSISADFPGRASSYPVEWLARIEDEQLQIEHLTYLAGMDQVPGDVLDAADAMRSASVSSELALHRVWWMLRP